MLREQVVRDNGLSEPVPSPCRSASLIIPGLEHLEVPLTPLKDNQVRWLLGEPSQWSIHHHVMLAVLTNNQTDGVTKKG